MKTVHLTMLEAEEGKILKKGNNYCQSVLLRKDETAECWKEITKEEYEKKEKYLYSFLLQFYARFTFL